MRKRICAACDLIQMQEKEKLYLNKNHKSKAHFYRNKSSLILTRIQRAVSVFRLNPCSEDHIFIMRSIRAKRTSVKRSIVKDRIEKLEHTRNLLAEAIQIYAQKLNTEDPNSEPMIKLEFRIRRYKKLIAQRIRRLKEYGERKEFL